MRDGLEDLWDLIAHMRKEKIAGTSTTIFHMNDVLLAYNAKVQSLLAEMKANARQGIQIGGPRKADSLLNAAQVAVQAGDMKQCCELLFEAGEQGKAISLAPAVSKEFWQALLRRRAEHIRAAGPATGERLEALLPLHILDGSAAALDQVEGVNCKNELNNEY